MCALHADVINFGGPVPELVTYRLAMLGFVTAIAAELMTGGWVDGWMALLGCGMQHMRLHLCC